MIKEDGEYVIRSSSKGTRQAKVKFVEDDRGISHLWFQKWNTKSGSPMGEQFVIYGNEIPELIEFLQLIKQLEIPDEKKFNRDFGDLKLVHLPDADARKVLEDHPELVAEFARSQITTQDVVALAYRKAQLNKFEAMLSENDLTEETWQQFFEQNQWIFGYGLSYVFTTGLDGENLQNTIRGASLIKSGKRPDAVMKTRAAISALCLVEIKKHSQGLLKPSQYRSGTWAPTAELCGAVAQTQENVRAALDELGSHHRFTDSNGVPTGEELTTVQPRSFLVVGNLSEFETEHGINEARYRSFEDYRRNLRQPEILTFDELYQRARFIVEEAESEDELNDQPSPSAEDDFEIPF
ncbi:Shedu immune nuclease family protein [Sulfitobacter sp. 20_GPM-1509m]|uniref:Shedu immune nuclease family protein n=1 Tax=Sulfitobacter sp. 20_GPM-1509m TaxID=1380367 RepID=UPI000686C0DA|nr:Shedu immune nuclease family protein [Sulfitobacter sp. 20_GPM-1509m]